MSQCSYIFPTSPLTHPWHPNWWKGAASPLLGLLLPLLLHLPLLLQQQLLLRPFPSVTPWLQPGGGKRPGRGWLGGPSNEDLWVARDRGRRDSWGGEGKGPCPLHASLLCGRPLWRRPRRAALGVLPWRDSAGEEPLTLLKSGAAPRGRRGGQASGPEEVGISPFWL